MHKLKIIFTVFVLSVFAGCASEYSRLDMRITGVLNPKDLVVIAADINSSGLPAADKNKLNVKLAKKTLKMAEIYIRMVADGKKTPQKEDLLDIINSLSKSLDYTDADELGKEIAKTIKSLARMLLR